MKITPGVTWASGDTVSHTKLNNFLTNATIGSGDLSEVALGDSALDSLTSGTDNVALGDNAGTAVTTGSDNVFLGQNAGMAHVDGDSNVAVGKDVFKTNTTGQMNVAIGEGAMGLSTGSPLQNVAVGTGSLGVCSGTGASTEAFSNTAVGHSTGGALTTGKMNTFLGALAGKLLTTNSSYNVAVGDLALGASAAAVDGVVAVGQSALTKNTADLNTGVGYNAGQATTSGDDNTYVGSQAGYTNITGADNVYCGDNAGYHLLGSNNTALGSQAMSSGGEAAYQNTTAVGYGVVTTASNQVMLGNTSVTDLRCEDTSISTVSSDARIKKSVKNNQLGLDFLNALRTVTYKKINPFNWPDEIKDYRFTKEKPDKKPADDKETHHGMIAQEVKAVMDEHGIKEWRGWKIDPNGKQNIAYGALIVPLVKAIQELSAKVTALEAAG